MKQYEVTLKRRDKLTKERLPSLTVTLDSKNEEEAYQNALNNLKSLQEKEIWEICGFQSVFEAE